MWVCSRQEAEVILKEGRVKALLSIYNPIGWGPLYPIPMGVNTCLMSFWDTNYPDDDGAPTLDIVSKAIDFLSSCPDEGLLINCEMGMSRSMAFAIVFNVLQGMSFQKAAQTILALYPNARPNKLIVQYAQSILTARRLPPQSPIWRREELRSRFDILPNLEYRI